MLRLPRGHHRASLVASLIVVALATGALATACGDGGSGWDAKSVAGTIEGRPFTPIITNSNLGAGKNRLSVALFDKNQKLVADAKVKATFFRLDKEPEGEPTNPQRAGEATLSPRVLKAEVDAHTDHDHGNDTTAYVTTVEFDRVGFWGMSLDVTQGGKTHRGLRMVFAVQERTLEPQVGDRAPASKQLVLSDVKGVEEVDSSLKPNVELHRLTVAQAVASGKPSVIAFVTPAFCQTRFCGPVLDQVITPAWNDFKGQANVLHIEPYDLVKARGGKLETVAAVQEWKLLAEPIVFVVGRDGVITAKFEGVMDYPEVKAAIQEALK